MKKTTKMILAGVAILLGLILALAQTRDMSISVDSLAKTMAAPQESIAPTDLAAMIIEGRNDFLILDIRPDRDFQQAHVLRSVNFSAVEILAGKLIPGAAPGEKLLFIIAGSESEAAQAALILRSRGHQAYVVRGGFPAWISQVLQPIKPDQFTSPEEARLFQEKDAVAAHFKGDSIAHPPTSPTLVKPVIPPPQSTQRKKSKGEGC